jgi:hypothetical protein
VDRNKVLSQNLLGGIAETKQNKTSARIIAIPGGIRAGYLLNTVRGTTD